MNKVEMAREIMRASGIDLKSASLFVREWFKDAFEFVCSVENVLDGAAGPEDTAAAEFLAALGGTGEVQVLSDTCSCGCYRTEFWLAVKGRWGTWESPSST